MEVPSQNRFQIEDHFLEFIQKQLEEGRISSFVESLSTIDEFAPYVSQWTEEESKDEESTS